MPAGLVVGDLLIGYACNGGGDVPATRPTGSTPAFNMDDGTVFNMDVVYKVAVGGDAAFTWTTATARRWSGGVVAVTAGTYNPVTPLNGIALAKGTTSNVTFTTGALTPASADTLLLAAFGEQAAGTWTTADTNPAMTELVDVASTGTSPTSIGVFRSNTPPAASSITRNATASLASANGGAVLIAVNPVVAVGPPPRPYIRTNSRITTQRSSRW
jgi:hypothetical protein